MALLGKKAGWCGVVLALIPSAIFWCHARDMPQFGSSYDDVLYFVGAKALASGNGYKIANLPGEPYQTKYPPVVSAILSLVWRIDPRFPGNLRIAAVFAWLSIPALLIFLRPCYRSLGMSEPRTIALILLMGINPFLALYGASIMSDILFTAMLVGCLWLVDRGLHEASQFWIAAAGTLGGLAYLTRTAGVMLLAAAFLYVWYRGGWRKAAVFGGFGFPAVLAWMLWTHRYRLQTSDPDLICYTDYFRYLRISFSLHDMPIVIWKNLDGVVGGLSGLFLPLLSGSTLTHMLSYVIAAAMLAGVVRLVLSGRGSLYACFATLYISMLLVWHWHPDQRLCFPLYPLALAGLLMEAEHFGGILRRSFNHSHSGERAVGALLSAGAIVLVVFAIGSQLYVGHVVMRQMLAQLRVRQRDRTAMYEFIRTATPPDATIYAENDGEIYLYTGRHSISRQIPPRAVYWDDHAAGVALYRGMVPYLRERGANYYFFSPADLSPDLANADRVAIADAVWRNPELSPIYRDDRNLLFLYHLAVGLD